MAFDFSTLAAEQRRIAHRAGRGDGDADRDALWIQMLIEQLGAASSTDMAVFKVGDYTPGGSPLSDGNIAVAIQTAYNAAVAAATISPGVVRPANVIIQIPYKVDGWHMGTTGLDLYGIGYLANIFLRGPCSLIWDAGFSGECIRLRGTTPAPTVFGRGGLRDIHIDFTVDPLAPITTAKGIVLDACVGTLFENVSVQNIGNGTGMYCRDFSAGGNNSQDCIFINTAMVNGNYCYDLSNLSTSNFYNTLSFSSNISDFKVDKCLAVAFTGGSSQSNPSGPIWDLSGLGGSRISINDWYTEGTDSSKTLFLMSSPSASFNHFAVRRYVIQSPTAKMFDAGSSVNLTIEEIDGASNATTFLKARGTRLHVSECAFTPDSAPSKFDLDADAYAHGSFVNTGGAVYGAHVTTNSISVASFAEGSEPGSPSAGWQVFNSSTTRPRIYNGTAWHDLGLADEPANLTDLLTPYAEEIWDPAIFSKLSVISSNLDTITGIVNGVVLSAPSSGRRPAFNTTDQYFGGKPSFDCAFTGDKCLSGTLAHVLANGTTPGFVLIARVRGGTAAQPRYFGSATDGGSHFFRLGVDDNNDPSKYYLDYRADGSAHVFPENSSLNLFARVLQAYVDPGGQGYIQVDANLGATQNGQNPVAGTGLSTIIVGGDSTATTHQGDVTIAYFAVLKSTMPATVRARALQLAKAAYSL